ncbi:uncharacterized protein TNCV_717561 [Trichonephila clavipes]|nr:uncharacterized protein TNCV_717561 [Trichonephila clavipes]
MVVTQLKTQRKSLRTSFTLSAKVIEEELMKKVPDVDELSILKMQISDKFSRLEKFQRAYEEDFMKAEIYRDRFSELCAKIERLSVKETGKKEVPEKRKFKLPKIELKKFDGNAKEYLTFWDKFSKKFMKMKVCQMKINSSICYRPSSQIQRRLELSRVFPQQRKIIQKQ